MKKKLNIKGLFKGLLREGLQAIPVVGTFVTNFKSDTIENPKGKIKLDKWDIYRIIVGILIVIALNKEYVTMKQLSSILEYIGF